MRLFTGIGMPEDVLRNLTRVIEQLRPTADIRWSTPENLHITTKFIGHLPDERLGELKDILRGLPHRQAFDVEISGLGWFPNPHSPRVFWAAVRGGDALKDLAADTERAVEPLGIEAEAKQYSPHLTLARIKGPAKLAGLRQAVAALPSAQFGRFHVDRFQLFRSTLSPKGSVYTVLDEFAL